MDLGVRSIRLAGNSSGSVEVTLPAVLRDLAGLRCRVVLRDGMRPEILLQPDFGAARDAFSRLWRQLALVLPASDPANDDIMPIAALTLTLQPAPERCGTGAVLAWTDGLALAAAPPQAPHAAARSIAALAQIRAAAIGIDPALACEFGAACAYAATAVVVHPNWEEACAIADFVLADPVLAEFAHPQRVLPGTALEIEDALSPQFWHAAEPALEALSDLFLGWTAHPDQRDAMRATWRHAIAAEWTGAASP